MIHRITGLGILFYLVAHITDTFFVVVSPSMYDHTMKLYGGILDGHYYWPVRWAFRLGELGLIACVLFHSINGLRIVLFDFWPEAAQHQRTLFRLVMIVFCTVMILVAIWVLMPLAETPQAAEPPRTFGPPPVGVHHDDDRPGSPRGALVADGARSQPADQQPDL